MTDGFASTVPALLIVIPLAAAALGRVPLVTRTRWAEEVVAIVGAAVTAGLALWLLPQVVAEPFVHWVGGWEPRDGVVLGVALVADGLAIGFVALASVLTLAVSVYAAGTYKRIQGLFQVLTMLLLAAVNGFVLCGDVFSMFVFVELVGITTYALTAYKVDDVGGVPAAFTIAVTSTIGAVLFLTGATLLYREAGSPNIAQIGENLAATSALDGGGGPAVAVAAALLLAGLSAKAGLVPWHFSHADSHTVAMAPHAGLFGAVTVPMGLYGITRLDLGIVSVLGGDVSLVLLTFALLTAVVCAVMALVQTHLKRVLAFSSAAHLGIAAVGVALRTDDGLRGTILYVTGHGLVKVALFLTVGVLLHRLGTTELGALRGRWREVKAAVVLLGLGGLLLAGAPPGGLFAGKVAIEQAATDVLGGWVMVPVYGASILTGAAVWRGVAHLVTGWAVGDDPIGRVAEGVREIDRDPDELPPQLIAVPALLVVAAVTMVAVPGFVDGAARVAAGAADRAALALLTVEGVAPEQVVDTGVAAWQGDDLVKGLVAVLGTLLLGVAAARDRSGTGTAAVGAPVRALRRLHTGHVGDYATWAIVGTAVWSVALLVLSG